MSGQTMEQLIERADAACERLRPLGKDAKTVFRGLGEALQAHDEALERVVGVARLPVSRDTYDQLGDALARMEEANRVVGEINAGLTTFMQDYIAARQEQMEAVGKLSARRTYQLLTQQRDAADEIVTALAAINQGEPS